MNLGYEFDAIVKFDGFGEVTVGTQSEAPSDVLITIRGGEYDDWHLAEGFLTFDLFENLKAVVTMEVLGLVTKYLDHCDERKPVKTLGTANPPFFQSAPFHRGQSGLDISFKQRTS